MTLAATHVVPLVKVHRAGNRGEALVAVMVVGVQGGGYTKMTSGREKVRRCKEASWPGTKSAQKIRS